MTTAQQAETAPGTLSVAAQGEFDVSEFPWGPVREVHRVGGYVIVEHDRVQYPNVSDEDFTPGALFHPYVPPQGPAGRRALNGGLYDCGQALESLDAALVYCVAFTSIWRGQGFGAPLNTQAPELFMRMVGADA